MYILDFKGLTTNSNNSWMFTNISEWQIVVSYQSGGASGRAVSRVVTRRSPMRQNLRSESRQHPVWRRSRRSGVERWKDSGSGRLGLDEAWIKYAGNSGGGGGVLSLQLISPRHTSVATTSWNTIALHGAAEKWMYYRPSSPSPPPMLVSVSINRPLFRISLNVNYR